MAYRKLILATHEIYHIYNRGVEKRLIFLTRRDYLRFVELTNYYRFLNCSLKFSYFKLLSAEKKAKIFKDLENKGEKLVEIFAYCLMPNHIHILLKQLAEKGISKFMAKTTSGYSHYFNKRHERVGHLFQGNFRAARIESEEQFLHVCRYIHLNPVTSYLIELENLNNYFYSSHPEYLGKRGGFCNTKEVLSHFQKLKNYQDFVQDQADYARKLENIAHLTLE